MLLAELRRVGCSRGVNDGNWNIAAQRSLSLFNEKARTTFDAKVASLDALNAVRSRKDRVCPLICERGYKAKGDDCVEIVCKAGFKLGDDNTCEPNKMRASTVRRPESSGKGTPTASTPPRTAGGSTMEDRYRACRKLVKGFAQREACARNGSI